MAVLVFLGLLAPVPVGLAPSAETSLAGQVRDDTGVVIPGATVEVIGIAGRTTVTNLEGRFHFDRLPTGKYRLRAVVPGFNTIEREVYLATSGALIADLVLQTAGISETISVSAESGAPASEPRADVIWNLWVDPAPGPQFAPVRALARNTDYAVVMDLAGLAYTSANGPIVSTLPKTGFQAQFSAWLKASLLHGADLEVLLLSQDGRIEVPDLAFSPMRIDLDKARLFAIERSKRRPSPPSLEDVGRHPDPPYTFGRAVVGIKTGGEGGWADLAGVVWSNGRPLDEFGLRVCIADSAEEESAACGGDARPVSVGFMGVDSLQAATGSLPAPDVSVHLVATPSGSSVMGVLRLNGSGKLFPWSLRESPQDFRDLMQTAVESAVDNVADADEVLQAGVELANVLFPSAKPESADDRARQALTTALAPRAGAPPSLFFRTVGALPYLFPLGLVALDGRFVGDLARIETPLTVQSYGTYDGCLSTWTLLSPPPSTTDDALRPLRLASGDSLTGWEERSTLYSDLKDFRKWLSDGREERQRVVVSVSHHEEDLLHFGVKGDAVPSHAVHKVFRSPTVAILNGCGTATAPAADLVRRLNGAGASAMIATVAEVDAGMAADFITCLDAELNRDAAGQPLSELYGRTLQCLGDKQDDNGQPRWGPKRFKYVLVGNGAIRMCRPTK